MKKVLTFILTLMFVPVMAQQTIEATVSSTSVTALERFNYEITVNSPECDISPPDFGGLDVVGGPFTSQSSSFSTINGQTSQKFEYKWTYTLRSKMKGTYTISPAKMSCGDERMESESITITVGAQTESTAADKDFYMQLTSNKSSVYEGEPFVLKLKYYSRLKPESFEGLELGDANSVYRKDLNPNRTTFQTGSEIKNGVRYYTIELREEVCFAQRHGTVRIEPYFTSIIVSRDFFNRYRKETYSNPLEIKVKKIPGSDRPDFNGLVGHFEISSDLSHQQVKMGEAIDINITIKGTGNLHDMSNIELDIPSEFDQFDPDITEKTSMTRNGSKGSVSYNFVVVPKHYGTYTIPGYSFTYFDLGSKQMRTIQTDDFVIDVAKRADVDIDPIKELPSEESEIRYIDQTTDPLFMQDDFLYGSWLFWFLTFGPIGISIIIIILIRKRSNRSEEELQAIDKRQVLKRTIAQLKLAQSTLNNGDQTTAQKEFRAAMESFFMTKFDLQRSDITQKRVSEELEKAGVVEENITQYNRIRNTLEMAQFAPITTENLSQTILDAEKLVHDLDKDI
jgi:hypothetical protein